MPATLRKNPFNVSALSLCAMRGPIHRSHVRFDEDPAPVVTPPAPATPAPAAPVVPPVEPAPVVPPATPVPAPAAAAPAVPAVVATGPLQRLRDLVSARATLTTELGAARSEVATLRSQLAGMTTLRDGLQARVTAFEQAAQAHNVAVAQLASDRTEFNRLLGDGVSTAMGALGVPEAALPASTSVPAAETTNEIFAHWGTLKGREKSAYYKLHEKILSKPQPK